MKRLTLNDAITNNSSVFQKAVNRYNSRIASPANNDDIYSKLQLEDFNTLAARFGVDKVGAYIRTKEAQRLKERRYGRRDG